MSKQRYEESHTWMEIDGDRGIIGITAHASEEFGAIVFVDLPTVGQKLDYGEQAVLLESTKAATEIYSPIAGTVLEVNEQLKETPELLNHSPESAGWLFRLAL
ncbi:MAG: glycine cleavage system protein H [Chlamydiota bacterium]